MSNAQERMKYQEALSNLQGKDVSEELLNKFDEEELVYFEKSLYENLLITKFKKQKSLSSLMKKLSWLEELFTELYADQMDNFERELESEEVIDYDKDDAEVSTEEVVSFNKIDTLNKLREYRTLKFQIELEKESLKMLSEQIAKIQHKI